MALYAAKEAVPPPTKMYVTFSGISGNGGMVGVVSSVKTK